MSILTVQHLEKHFENTKVLNDISFSLEEGQALSIIGSSGSGKTTLLRCLNFLETPDAGTITVQDKVLFDADHHANCSEKEIRKNRLHFGMVFQSFNLFPQYTALENVTLARELMAKDTGESKEAIRAAGMELLDQMGLADRAGHYPHQLSGGQQQRVAIARALVKEPRLLLLDEPLSNLDARLRLEMREEIRRIQLQTQVTTIFVTHDQEEAMSISDHIVLMRDGVMQQFDQPQVLYDDPANQFVADFLGNPPINNLPGTVRGGVFTTEDGKASVKLPLLARVPEGKKVNLSVRSESFQVAKAPGEDTMRCQVTGVFKTGKEEMASFLFGDVAFRAYIDLEEGLQKGQEVDLALKNRGVFVFDRESGVRY